ncbi:hypothetical protein CKA32_001984 [Geitlerinema sp. FC II]|nr:hypothetical protein CKA32_001984 [Geitlerinema sp. FC II]
MMSVTVSARVAVVIAKTSCYSSCWQDWEKSEQTNWVGKHAIVIEAVCSDKTVRVVTLYVRSARWLPHKIHYITF